MPDPTVTLYDEHNQPVQMPADQATRAFAEGGYGVAGERVPVVSSRGTAGTVPADQLQDFIRRGGRLASGEEAAQAQYESQHQGIGSDVAAVAHGAVGNIPFVGSNILEAGGMSPEEQRRERTAHPLSSGVGQAFEIGAELAGPELISAAARGLGLAGHAAEAASGAAELARGAETVNAAEHAVAPVIREGSWASRNPAIANSLPPEAVSEIESAASRGATSEIDSIISRSKPATSLSPTGSGNALTDLAGRDAAETAAVDATDIERRLAAMGAGPVEQLRNPVANEAATGLLGEEVGALNLLPPELAPAETAVHDALTARLAEVEGSQGAREAATSANESLRSHLADLGLPPVGPEAQLLDDAVSHGTADQAQRALGLMARTAAEGGLYSAGQYINEANLHDIPLTAEGLLAAAGEGAALGGVLGAGIHGLGGARRALASTFGRDASELASDAARMNLRSTIERFGDLAATSHLASTGKLRAKAAGLAEQELGRFINTFEDRAGTFRGILGKADDVVGDASRAETALRETGEHVAETVITHDGVASTGPIVKHYYDTLLKLREKGMATFDNAAKRIEAELGNRLEHGEMKLSDMWQMRRDIDKVAKWSDTAEGTIANQELKALRMVVDDTIQAALLANRGPEAAAQYAMAKKNYRFALWARDATQHALTTPTTHGALGAAGIGSAASVLMGHMNPAQAAVALAGGAVLDYAKKNYKRLAAVAADRASRTNALNSVAEHMNSAAAKAAKSVLSSVPRAAFRAESGHIGRQEAISQYQKAAPALYAAVSTGQVGVPERLQRLATAAPSLYQQAMQINRVRAAYLTEKLGIPQGATPLQAIATIRSASPAQMVSFSAYSRAVADPSVYFKDVANNSLKPETVEAIKVTAPAVAQAMDHALETALASHDKPLTPEAKKTVSLILGADPGLRSPQTVAMLQASYATPAAGSPAQAPSPSIQSLNVAQDTASAPDLNQARLSLQGPG